MNREEREALCARAEQARYEALTLRLQARELRRENRRTGVAEPGANGEQRAAAQRALAPAAWLPAEFALGRLA
jgi:hypothetical protein